MTSPIFTNHVVGHGSLSELCPMPTDKISSNLLFSTSTSKQLVFCVPAGQELSDHQTPHVAVICLLDGAATVRVAGESIALTGGGVVVIPPRVTHAVQATQPTRFLLTLAKELEQ